MSSPSLTGNEGHMPFIYFEIPAKILLKDLDSLVLNFEFYMKIIILILNFHCKLFLLFIKYLIT